MKYIFFLILAYCCLEVFGQISLPVFLEGTWKVKDNEIYEHWDKLNDNKLKGLSYRLTDGKMIVSEYLDIRLERKKITYSASVLNQNQGKEVQFNLSQTDDSTWIFSNANHDFPKKIIYKKMNDLEIFVQISDSKDRVISYILQKQIIQNAETISSNENPNFDEILAKRLGGDDHGMKSYILVILKTGTNSTSDKTVISESFRGHLENIKKLVGEGKMLVAGPLGKNELTYRGIFILNVESKEEAHLVLKSDAAIRIGLLDYDLYDWYGSAALSEYLKYSDRIWKIKP